MLKLKRVSLYKSIFNALVLCLFVLVLTSLTNKTVQAAANVDNTSRAFDIASGSATVSLKIFSEQSQCAIMYPSESMDAIQTNSVHGLYLPKDALQIMLLGTQYKVIEDSITGALAVKPLVNEMKKERTLDIKNPSASKDMNGVGNTLVMNKYLVTGSYLPISADAPAIPITSVDIKDIEDSGTVSDLQGVLTKIAPQFGGNLNLGPNNGNSNSAQTNGGGQVALRNLATLVLINGHRLAFAGAAAIGGNQFVDLNLIPTSAVQRIEIDTGGASAIYGSDAVGGVVNVILKSNYNGFEVGERYGSATNLLSGSYHEKSLYVTGGSKSDNNSITISAEWSSAPYLSAIQNPITSNYYASSGFPGVINSGINYYVLNPALSAPPNPGTHTPIATLVANGVYSGPYTATQIQYMPKHSLSPYSCIGLANERKAAILGFDHVVNDDLKISGNILFSQTDTYSQIGGSHPTYSSPATDPDNPTTSTVTASTRFTDFPQGFPIDTVSFAALVQLDGKLNDRYSWSASADWNSQKQHYQETNLVTLSTFNSVVENAINMFAYNTDAAITNSGIFGTAYGEYRSNLKTFDGVFTGKPFSLPAGDFQFAFGAEIRDEVLSASADKNSLLSSFNWIAGRSISPLTASRSINAYFGQFNIPLVSPTMVFPFVYSLELDGAIRHESYQYVNSKPTVPLISLRYQPLGNELTIRSSYSESFIAPTLYQAYGPTAQGASPTLTNFRTAAGVVIANATQAHQATGSNPKLNPTKAKNLTAGFVYAPKWLKGFSITADYFWIKESDVIGVANAVNELQSVELLGTASPFINRVTLGNYAGQVGSVAITVPGQVAPVPANVYLINNQVNLGGIAYTGMDTRLNYNFGSDHIGLFDLSTKITYNFSYFDFGPDRPGEQTAGRVTAYNGTMPRFRAYTSLSYTKGNWNVYVANLVIPSLYDSVNGLSVKSYYTLDGSVSYKFTNKSPGMLSIFHGLKASVGVNNINNRKPSYDTTFQTNTDLSTYNPIDRLIYTQLKYVF
jgi:iron complex outermembrane receptor protein